MHSLWSLSRKTLTTHWVRSALTIAAIAIGMATILGVQVTVQGANQESTQLEYFNAGNSSLDIRSLVSTGISPQQINTISHMAGISNIGTLTEKRIDIRLSLNSIIPQEAFAIGIDSGNTTVALRTVIILSGHLPASTSISTIAIDKSLADTLASTELLPPPRLGNTIFLSTPDGSKPFTIVGFTNGTSGGSSFTQSAVFISQDAISHYYSTETATPLVAVHIATGHNINAVSALLSNMFGATAIVTNPKQVLASPLEQMYPLLTFLVIVTIIFGIGITANTITINVYEQQRDIGLLRAAGANNRHINILLFSESAMLFLIALPIGLIIGVLAGILLTLHYSPPGVPFSLSLLSFPELVSSAALALLSVLSGTLIATYAARKISILSVIQSTSHKPQHAVSPLTVILLILSFLLGIITFTLNDNISLVISLMSFIAFLSLFVFIFYPFLVLLISLPLSLIFPYLKLSINNFTHQTRRIYPAALGITLSVTITIASSILILGTLHSSDTWISHLFIGSSIMTSPVTQNDLVLQDISKTAGINTASPIRVFSATFNRQIFGVTAINAQDYNAYDGFQLLPPQSRSSVFTQLQNHPDILIPVAIQQATGWNVGTQVSAVTSANSDTFTVAGIIQHSLPSTNDEETIVMAQSVAKQHFGSIADGFNTLNIRSANTQAQLTYLAAEYGMQFVSVSSIIANADSSLLNSVGIIFALIALDILMVFLGAVTTLAASIHQNRRDIGLFRAVGMSRMAAYETILFESGFIAIVSIIFGLIFGSIFSIPLLHALATPGFTPGFYFSGIIAIILTIIAFIGSLLCTLPPLRRIVTHNIMVAQNYE